MTFLAALLMLALPLAHGLDPHQSDHVASAHEAHGAAHDGPPVYHLVTDCDCPLCDLVQASPDIPPDPGHVHDPTLRPLGCGRPLQTATVPAPRGLRPPERAPPVAI